MGKRPNNLMSHAVKLQSWKFCREAVERGSAYNYHPHPGSSSSKANMGVSIMGKLPANLERRELFLLIKNF